MLKDKIKTIVDYDDSGSIIITATLIAKAEAEIPLDFLHGNEIELISIAKEQAKLKLLEELEND